MDIVLDATVLDVTLGSVVLDDTTVLLVVILTLLGDVCAWDFSDIALEMNLLADSFEFTTLTGREVGDLVGEVTPLDREVVFLTLSVLLTEDKDEADDEALAGREEVFQEVVVEEGTWRCRGDDRGELEGSERMLLLRDRLASFCKKINRKLIFC